MSKYHAIKVTEDGITFDSKAEHRRYRELKLLQAAGEIADLQVHVKFPLMVNGISVGAYEADFVYSSLVTPWASDNQIKKFTTEDVKGVKTPVYQLKKKLMRALHGIEIVEVEA